MKKDHQNCEVWRKMVSPKKHRIDWMKRLIATSQTALNETGQREKQRRN